MSGTHFQYYFFQIYTDRSRRHRAHSPPARHTVIHITHVAHDWSIVNWSSRMFVPIQSNTITCTLYKHSPMVYVSFGAVWYCEGENFSIAIDDDVLCINKTTRIQLAQSIASPHSFHWISCNCLCSVSARQIYFSILIIDDADVTSYCVHFMSIFTGRFVSILCFSTKLLTHFTIRLAVGSVSISFCCRNTFFGISAESMRQRLSIGHVSLSIVKAFSYNVQHIRMRRVLLF